jgi:maleate isomerase
MTQQDNWGWQARIGMFIVGSEAVPEAEWWAMMPPHVSVHAARVTAKTPWAAWRDNRSGVELADDVVHGATQFASMRLNAVTIGHSSSSIMGGAGWDEAVTESLAEILKPEVAVTTNGLDCVAGLTASGVKRPFVVFPAWFGDQTLSAGAQYFTDRGLAPGGHLRFDPGRNWRDVAPSDMYPKGLGFAQEIEPLYNQIRAACPVEADGVLIAGTGFRCVGIIEALERDLKRPVVTANQASLWHCLRLSGVTAKIENYGSLLRL